MIKHSFWVVFPLFLARASIGAPLTQAQLGEKLKKYASVNTIEASFFQTKTLKDMGLELKSEGHFKVKRPREITWDVTKPSAVRISMTQDEVRIQSAKDQDTQVYKLSSLPSRKLAQSLSGLLAWLDLDAVELSRHYNVFEKNQTQFQFIPKTQGFSPFKDLTMTLGQDGLVSHIFISENSGDTIALDFRKTKITKK